MECIACKHEPFLCYNPNYKGGEICFLQQVDDFAISAPNSDLANEIIYAIDSHMTIKVKPLEMIDRFNGVDVQQTRNYIKLHNATYIKNILHNKNILVDHDTHVPIPMYDDST